MEAFSNGQVVVVDDPGMGYAYNGIIVGRETDGRYWVAAADGTAEDHKPQYLTSAGWRAF